MPAACCLEYIALHAYKIQALHTIMCSYMYYKSSGTVTDHTISHCRSSSYQHPSPTHPYQCLYCGKLYRSRSGKQQHERFHTGRTVNCTTCGKCFPTKIGLKLHQDAAHDNIKYTCELCTRSFSYLCGLRTHKEEVCERNAPLFACTLCQKSYASEAKLLRHSQAVHGQVKFVCTGCGRNFGYVSALQRHQKQTKCGNTDQVT